MTWLADDHPEVAEVRAVARDTLLPLAGGAAPGLTNRPLLVALGETGLTGRIFPDELGGSAGAGVSAARLCRLREALAWECTEAETTLAVQGLATTPIVQSARPDVAARYVPDVAAGRAAAAFALTEAGAGSDAAALSLTATPDGDGWRLTGEKLWISGGADADVLTVFARTTPDAGSRGVSAFVVPGDAPGLHGEPLTMLSPHAIGRVVFDDVPVAGDHLLGELDRGFRVAMRTLDLFRPSVGAFALGMAEAALDAAVAWATEREAFGRPIAEFQAVSHPLADAAVGIEAARALVAEAAAAYDEGRADTTTRSAIAKLAATETAQRVVDTAVQVVGARALQRGHVLEHLYREVRAPRIYEGTSEIQRELIARALLRP